LVAEGVRRDGARSEESSIARAPAFAGPDRDHADAPCASKPFVGWRSPTLRRCNEQPAGCHFTITSQRRWTPLWTACKTVDSTQGERCRSGLRSTLGNLKRASDIKPLRQRQRTISDLTFPNHHAMRVRKPRCSSRFGARRITALSQSRTSLRACPTHRRVPPHSVYTE